MTAKEYLSQAKTLDRRINIELKKIEKLRSVLEYRSPSWDGTGSGSSGGDRLSNAISKIVEYEKKTNKLIDEYTALYGEIDHAIHAIDDEDLVEVLERRYLLYQKWESIAKEMRLDLRWIYRLHGRALARIKIDH